MEEKTKRFVILIVIPFLLFGLERVNLIKNHGFEKEGISWQAYKGAREPVETEGITKEEEMKFLFIIFCAFSCVAQSKVIDVSGYTSKPWLIKLDSLGDTVWTKTFQNGLEGINVGETPDKGYILITSKRLVFKTDSFGDSLWTLTSNLVYGQRDCFKITSDSGGILVGFDIESNELSLLKFDLKGKSLWMHNYNLGKNVRASSVIESSDKGYVALGENYPPGLESSLLLLKTNSKGDSLWSFTLNDAQGGSLIETPDNGYIFTGTGKGRMLIAKVDNNGKLLWSRSYGNEYGDWALDILKTNDNCYFLTGRRENRYILMSINSQGEILWTRPVAFKVMSFEPTKDGNYVSVSSVVDETERDIRMVKFKENGDILKEWAINEPGYEEGNAVQETTDGGYIITGLRDLDRF